MHKKILRHSLLVACISFIFICQTFAMNIEAYNKMKNSDKTENKIVLKAYIRGLGTGYRWSSSINKAKGGKPFFCLPAKLSLNAENYISIIDGQLKKYESNETPIEPLLYDGLVDVFPCVKTDKLKQNAQQSN